MTFRLEVKTTDKQNNNESTSEISYKVEHFPSTNHKEENQETNIEHTAHKIENTEPRASHNEIKEYTNKQIENIAQTTNLKTSQIYTNIK